MSLLLFLRVGLHRIGGRSSPSYLFRKGLLCLMAMASLTLRLMVLFGEYYSGQTARFLPFVKYPGQRTPVPWYFCRFWALPGHRSQHQPTQCKSTTWRKQQHQAQSEGGHFYKTKESSLIMDEGLDLPPLYNPPLGILLRNLSPPQRWWRLSDSDEIFVCILVFRSEFWNFLY